MEETSILRVELCEIAINEPLLGDFDKLVRACFQEVSFGLQWAEVHLSNDLYDKSVIFNGER